MTNTTEIIDKKSSIFASDNYKSWIKSWIETRPGGGRGELRRIASHLRVHPTLVSQVIHGEKDFSLENAALLTEYFNLSKDEAAFFLLLIQHARAGSETLRALLKRQLDEHRDRALDLSKQLGAAKSLSETDQAVFYSNWIYSAIRILTSTPHGKSAVEIATFLGIPIAKTEQTLSFLLSRGLCRIENGRYCVGAASTHLEADSPFIAQHHRNWRHKAMERHPFMTSAELSYSGLVSISESDARGIRDLLVEHLKRLRQTVEATPTPDELYIANIDWVRFPRSVANPPTY